MSTSTPPSLDTGTGQLNRRAWGVLFVLCGALFLDALDVSMMGVALPSIQNDLGMSTGSLQWVVSAYVLGYGGFLLLGGRAADLFGRRRMFLISLAVFIVASAVAGFSNDGLMLIIARFVTGVSAAFTGPAGLSIITTSFAEGPARNKAISIYTATGAAGFSLGLVVGGLLTGISWQWVFYVPVLIALVTLAAAFALVPDGGRPVRSSGGFDVAGAITVTAAMMLLVYTLVEAPVVGWGSARTLGSLVLTALIFGLFVLIEQRVAAPLVRLGILRSAGLLRANLGAIALQGAWVGCLFVITLWAQELRGWSAVQTGLAVCPAGLTVVLLAPRIAPPLIARFGPTRVIVAGLLAAVAAYALFLRIDLGSSYVAVMLPTILLIGVAFSLAYGPLNIVATNGVAADEQGLAGGLVNTSFQIGPALVLAAAAAVNNGVAGDGGSPEVVLDGLHAALIVPLVAAAIGVIANALGLLGKRRTAVPVAAAEPTAAD